MKLESPCQIFEKYSNHI